MHYSVIYAWHSLKGSTGQSSRAILGLPVRERTSLASRRAGITENTLTQSNKPKGDKILELLAGYIDGKHAVSPADLRIVASVGTNVLWMTKLQAATVDNMTVAQFLRASGISWTTRGGIDTNTSNGDFGAYIGLAQGIAGAAVKPLYGNLLGSLVRDPFSA